MNGCYAGLGFIDGASGRIPMFLHGGIGKAKLAKFAERKFQGKQLD